MKKTTMKLTDTVIIASMMMMMMMADELVTLGKI